MKRKILLSILSLACASLTACGFVGGGTANSGATGEQTQMEQIYAQYVVYAQAEGIQPLSYEAWLATVKGEDGKSAYQIWLDNGHSGSQADFLEWLKGDKGEDGAQGIQGEQGVQGEKGEQGIQGEKGDQGEQGVQGEKGDKGDQGEKGDNGEDGRGIASIQLVGCQLVITYTDGTVDTFDMPVGGGGSSAPTHNYGDWLCFSGEDLSCDQRIFYRICEGCNDVEWKKGSAEDHKWAAEYSYDKNYHWCVCENCDGTMDYAEHTLDEDAGECSVCYAPMTATAGVLYDLSADGTYAEVIGYEGTASKVKIADAYEGVPVTGICQNAFYQKYNITSVIIPDSVTSIGEWAFYNCYRLTSVVIPDSVTSIGNYAFYHCDRLTSVVIGDSVTSIGFHAFFGCDSLTNVVIPDSVTSIGEEPFGWCDSLINITVGENNANYKDIDGNLYSKDGKTLIQYAIGKKATSFTIPDGVTSIGYGAFHDNDYLKCVVIPDGVTKIERCAFRYCNSLTSVAIPDSVTSIAYEAFDECENLTFTEYGNCKYLGNESNPYLALIKASNQNYSTYTIHEDTKVIADHAFSNCSRMASIVIPDSVTSIGEGAFSSCSSLTSVYYKGTASDWSELGVNDWNINYATRYYYSESAPTEEGNYWYYDENGEIAVW